MANPSMMARFALPSSRYGKSLIINNLSGHFSGEAVPAKSVSVRAWLESGSGPQKLTNRPFWHHGSRYPATLLRVKHDTPTVLNCHIMSAAGAAYM
jgi:hypothetical protein